MVHSRGDNASPVFYLDSRSEATKHEHHLFYQLFATDVHPRSTEFKLQYFLRTVYIIYLYKKFRELINFDDKKFEL